MKLLRVLWLDVLSDVDDAALQAATHEYVRSNATFAPAPGMLRQRAAELVNGSLNERAELGWHMFKDNDYGHGDPITDPIVSDVIRLLGGAYQIGQMDSEKVDTFVRREFCKMYAERAQKQDVFLSLPETVRLRLEAAK